MLVTRLTFDASTELSRQSSALEPNAEASANSCMIVPALRAFQILLLIL